jgi:hypothetical protein
MKSTKFLKLLIIFLGILILLNACTLKTTKAVSLTVPKEKKIPLRVGYYVEPNLSKLKYLKKTLGGEANLLIGETMCNGIEAVVSASFEDVIKLSSLDIDLTSQKIKAVVIPEIISIDMNIPLTTASASIPAFGLSSLLMKGEDVQAIVKMKWTITDTEKNILYVKTITGEGHNFCKTVWCRRDVMELAIQDQFQKALESILTQEWAKPIK